jgi:hypothetical protein
MRSIELRFGTPVHGWLDVELSGSGGQSKLDASDVPGNSLSMLACVACALMDGYPPCPVTWLLEPVEEAWTFRLDGERIHVVVSTDGVNFRKIAAATAGEVALAIWRALRRLEADPAWSCADGERIWSRPFPHAETAQLGQKLGRLP